MTDSPDLHFALGSIVVPGDKIGTIRQVRAGPGTYLRGGQVFASVVGPLQLDEAGSDGVGMAKYQASVASKKPILSAQVLKVGDTVLAKVLRISQQQATLTILATLSHGTLAHFPEGVIRREDIRAGATEEAQIEHSFLPGDWVLCHVLSLGDSRRYHLSTAAAPHLGVLMAYSDSSHGVKLRPISHDSMVCPVTGIKERRKVARPRNLSDKDVAVLLEGSAFLTSNLGTDA